LNLVGSTATPNLLGPSRSGPATTEIELKVVAEVKVIANDAGLD